MLANLDLEALALFFSSFGFELGRICRKMLMSNDPSNHSELRQIYSTYWIYFTNDKSYNFTQVKLGFGEQLSGSALLYLPLSCL